MLVVVLGGVKVRVQAVTLHLAEQVHPLAPRPRAVVESLGRTILIFMARYALGLIKSRVLVHS